MNTRALEFRDQLSRRALVGDGAMGTMLYSRGMFINRCFDELNLSDPDLVRQIGSQTALLIGVGANPGALNLDEEIRRFELKVEAGAEYAVTQPVFDLELLERFLRRIAHVKIPLLCGIWPLTSHRNAEFLVNELRVPVPEPFMKRMRLADSAEKARQEGVAIAQEMVARVRPMVQGVQLSPPFGRYQLAIEVAEAIGPR